jgi:hypothetical protein
MIAWIFEKLIAAGAQALVNAIVAQVILWYVKTQKTETLHQFADAAAFAARASTDEERYQASEKWKLVLSRPRLIA